MAFTAAIFFAFYFLIGRSIRQKTNWINYVFYVYLSATVTTLVMLFILSGFRPELTQTAILISFFLAIGPTIVGHGSMNYAVKYFSATLLSTLILAEAAIASLMAFFLFGEAPSALSLLAMGIILAGIAFTWKKNDKTT
jgi:drug/metabolite transporter (DMT)-like permease